MRKTVRILIVISLLFNMAGCKDTKEKEEEIPEEMTEKMLKIEEISELPYGQWELIDVFPKQDNDLDDTLAMNSISSFKGYDGQGELYIRIDKDISSFTLYINGERAEFNDVVKDKIYHVDYADYSINGSNTV
ncbi:MAG: hypothetical protein J6S49_00110, partial [Erysipelotrichaceae bacterium]|nr:hypothetical protein [Erysipelotrichaceae bacterium]